MAGLDELALPTFGLDRFTSGGEHFHTDLQALAAEHRLARLEGIGYVVLARDDVDAVLRTRHATMPALQLLELQGVTDGPVHRYLAGNLLSLDGEPHRRQRHLVAAAFSPARASELRPVMRAHVRELLGAVLDAGACEFVADVAKPYPARMIAEIVGAPAEDAARLGEWAYWIQCSLDPIKVGSVLDRIEQAAGELEAYVADLLTTPVDRAQGVLAEVLPSLATDELTHAQAVSLIAAVLVGGVDTTQAQLAQAMRLFAQHPEQWQALVADPTLVPAAVEEVLRYEPIAPFTARLVTEELHHRDWVFPAGTLLVACAATANRDPEVYADPEHFDITADRGDHAPLAFGAGPHFCIGHALAKAELEEALRVLAEHLDEVWFEADPVYDTPSGIYGLLELPLGFRVADRATRR